MGFFILLKLVVAGGAGFILVEEGESEEFAIDPEGASVVDDGGGAAGNH